jgi:hypothetical protein
MISSFSDSSQERGYICCEKGKIEPPKGPIRTAWGCLGERKKQVEGTSLSSRETSHLWGVRRTCRRPEKKCGTSVKSEVKAIDKPIKPTKHYIVWTDEILQRESNLSLYTRRDSYAEECPAGTSHDRKTTLLNGDGTEGGTMSIYDSQCFASGTD